MIENVTYEFSTFRSDNAKFEAGTMNIAQVVGLSAAVDYLQNVGMNVIHEHVKELTGAALKAMISMPGIRILGPTDLTDREGLISFEVDGVHPHDVSQFLDSKGVAVRAGHHCAWPLHRKLGAVASSRASFYLYNTKADVDVFLAALDGNQILNMTHEGVGCSISRASASVLHALTKEETTETFHVLLDNFVDLMHSQGKVVPDEEVLGDAAAFAGVSKYPARVKCALLPWMAMKDAIEGAGNE
jgi:SUF system NifU family Fe-S assembly protein